MPRDPRTGLEIFGPVNEGTTFDYVASGLKDQTGQLVTSTVGATIEAEIFDSETGQVIAPRRDILNTGSNGLDGVFDVTTSNLTVTVNGDLVPILNQRLPFEDHVLLISWSFNNGSTKGNHSVLIRVRNLRRVGDH